MKVTIAVHHFLPRYYAGAELIAYRQARWLHNHGVDVEVITIESIDRGKPGEIEAWDEPYDGIPVKRLACNLVDSSDSWLYSYTNAWLGEWFKEYISERQPDVVHFHSGYLFGASPMRASADAGIPFVLTIHDYWFFCPQITLLKGDGSICPEVPHDPVECAWCLKLNSRRYSISEKYTLGLVGKFSKKFSLDRGTNQIQDRRDTLLSMLGIASAVITPTKFLYDMAKPFTDDDHLVFSRYGLDFIPSSGTKAIKRDESFRIGYIGQIAPHKGVHLLVEAFKALDDKHQKLELHIHGGLDKQLDYIRKLEKMSADDSRIHFRGKFDNSQVGQILGEFDVLVVPSVWHEIGPLTIMEAFLAKTPVICSPIGNMRDIVQNGVNGLHFNTGDAVDLAEKLQSLVNYPETVEKLRSGIVPPRSLDDEMEQLLNVYQNVVREIQPV